jgi:hypothetical protein
MARTEIPIVVIDPATGNAVSGASVTVVNRATSSNATIYAGETGGTTAANPRTTDANGRLTGWVERGPYRLDITGSSLTSYSKNWDSATAADASMDGLWIAQGAIVLGFQSLQTSYPTTGTHTTYQDEGLSFSATYRASRILRVSWNGGLFAGGGAQRIKIKALRGATSLFEFSTPTIVNNLLTEAYGFSYVFAGPSTAGTETFKMQVAAVTANTSVQSSGTAAQPRTLLLEDLGPQ